MVGGKCSANDVSERLRRNVVGQLARGERPWGRWDEPLGETMVADSWGVRAVADSSGAPRGVHINSAPSTLPRCYVSPS